MAQFHRDRRRRAGITAGELRIMLLGGIMAGLVVSQLPGGTVPRSAASTPARAVSANFALCHSGGGIDCVVDGDTFWMGGEKIRTDRYGRKLRVAMRDGASLGDTLIAEGLARPWEGRRRLWCDAQA